MFESIYYWFVSLFGEPLAEHMLGYRYDPASQIYDYFGTNLFNVCGIITLITSALVCILFYYLWNPAYRKRLKWFLMLFAVMTINFVIGWATPYSDLINENINVGEGMIVSGLDCIMFGFSNLIVSACFFIIISYIIRWWSSGNKYIPFLTIK